MNKDLYLDVLEHKALLFMTGNNITISIQDNAPVTSQNVQIWREKLKNFGMKLIVLCLRSLLNLCLEE